MRARTRSRLLRLSLITTVVGIVALFTPFHDDWIMILKASLLLGAFALAMVWAVTKSMGDVQAPDILAQHITSEGGFDANGLTLLPHFEVIDCMCWLHLFYQNRLTSSCNASVFVVPMEGVSRTADLPHEVPPLSIPIECDGGEVGVISLPYPIARSWQGKIMIFDTYAVTKFREPGEEIRPQRGPKISGPDQEITGLLLAAALLPGGVWFLATSSTESGKIEFRLPEGVSETIATGLGVRKEILWKMDQMPTRGFPVTSPAQN